MPSPKLWTGLRLRSPRNIPDPRRRRLRRFFSFQSYKPRVESFLLTRKSSYLIRIARATWGTSALTFKLCQAQLCVLHGAVQVPDSALVIDCQLLASVRDRKSTRLNSSH